MCIGRNLIHQRRIQAGMMGGALPEVPVGDGEQRGTARTDGDNELLLQAEQWSQPPPFIPTQQQFPVRDGRG